jgi:hypothetical protein
MMIMSVDTDKKHGEEVLKSIMDHRDIEGFRIEENYRIEEQRIIAEFIKQ